MKRLRYALGKLRNLVRLHKWPAFVGRLSLLYHRLLYPNLRVGRRVRVRGSLCIVIHDETGEIVLGDRVRIVSDWKRSPLARAARAKLVAYPGARIVLGSRTLLMGTTIVCRKAVEIGDETMIAPDVLIADTDFHALWPPEQRFEMAPVDEARDVRIGKRAWIGAGAFILKGVTIGENAVVGAGSVVTKDVPPATLVAGNPARVIRELGPDAADSNPA